MKTQHTPGLVRVTHERHIDQYGKSMTLFGITARVVREGVNPEDVEIVKPGGIWGRRAEESSANGYGMDDGECEANARHLVACWNAIETAGIDPAAVEELVETMKAHRDACAESAEGCDPFCCGSYLQDTVEVIDAALAKARPEPKGDDDGVHDRPR